MLVCNMYFIDLYWSGKDFKVLVAEQHYFCTGITGRILPVFLCFAQFFAENPPWNLWFGIWFPATIFTPSLRSITDIWSPLSGLTTAFVCLVASSSFLLPRPHTKERSPTGPLLQGASRLQGFKAHLALACPAKVLLLASRHCVQLIFLFRNRLRLPPNKN